MIFRFIMGSLIFERKMEFWAGVEFLSGIARELMAIVYRVLLPA